jgi:uncharacterized protein YjbI with pentapeptide repeats
MFQGLFGPSKQRLIEQMGSSDNQAALQAVEKLKDAGWFRDGSLVGINLSRANLQGAALARANMERAILQAANLSKAYLGETILRAADLREAVLCDANMREVILREATLTAADLRRVYLAVSDLVGATLNRVRFDGANFWQTRLYGADLSSASLAGASFYDARFDSETRLPDGSPWTPDADLARFTDPNHPDFWSPDRMNGYHR